MSKEMLAMFHPYLDAVNVDLKAFREETYHRYVGAGLQPVLDNLKLMMRLGIWLEVTTLVISGINDNLDDLHDVARFIARELGPDTPWHISRFFPGYLMADRPPTPIETLQRTREIGLAEGLHYVYLGNVSSESNTVCHHCGRILVRRQGYRIAENHIREGACPACDTPVAGIWTG
jgi:pyruvate formate lyase activating enzyme